MTFFNKKEDIIEIQLTPYGRRLLSRGKLKPAYYAFYDDDILYDSNKISENAGTSENNSESKTRILTNTPSLKPLTTNFGIEENISVIEPAENIDHHMMYPIGTNSNVYKKTSGWNAISLSKEFESFTLTSSVTSTNASIKSPTVALSIPQVNCKLEFTMSAAAPDSQPYGQQLNNMITFDSIFLPGDKILQVDDESLVLYLLEKNGFANNDSFEVEVFLYEEDESDLTKLHFLKRQERVVDGMLVQSEASDQLEPTKENVEYYIDLLLDKEVPDEDICNNLERLKDTSIYSELDLTCPEREILGIDIYTSTTVDDVEECD